MEVERHTEVRLATWLCEAIEDSIKRFQTSAEQAMQMAEEDFARVEEEKEKSKDPALAKVADPGFYSQQAERWQRFVDEDKQAIDQLLSLLQSGNTLREKIIKFWEERKARYEDEA